MSIVARMAEVAGASELLDITGAHIDSTVYIGDAGLGAGGGRRRLAGSQVDLVGCERSRTM